MPCKRGVLLAGWLLFTPSMAFAQVTQKQKELEQTNRALEQHRQQNEKIEQHLDQLENELDKLSGEVTGVADNLQSSEQDFYGLEKKLTALESEYALKQKALAKKSRQLSAMLSTMIRIAQVPQETAILMPASFTDRMIASRAVSLTSRALKGDMDALTVDLAELKTLKKELDSQRRDVASEKERLQGRRLALRDIIDKRKELMDSLHSEQSEQQKSIQTLARKAGSLQSLVASLEKARQDELERQAKAIGVPVLKPVAPGEKSSQPGAAARLAPVEVPVNKGSLRLPVAGSVVGRYGDSRGQNDTLRGLEIATASGAQVTAPSGGEVLYTGNFLDYGQMVIIRHSHQYHTLLAGFARVDCTPGQRLLAGEPIGVMGNAPKGKRLYMELRQAGKPIDPLPWLSGGKALLAAH